jgi:RNA polymerase sigma factor (sigma-70 family)
MSKSRNLDNESILIEACINNDPKAQRYLFDKYGSKMLGVCARYCRNLEDARDAMQDGFVKIFGIIEKFNGNSKLETWMTRVMINTAIDHFKKENKYILFDSNEHILSDDNGEEDQLFVEENVELDEDTILNVLSELPDGYRVVFSLYVVDGMSHKQIATHLGISEGTSKSQLARARKFLQDLLIAKGLVER